MRTPLCRFLPLLLAGPIILPAQTPAPAALPPPATIATPAASRSAIETSVVKIFATIRAPDLSKPWTRSTAREVTGSGVVIDGNRIITNAHVVTYANEVQVQGTNLGDKAIAKVEAIAPGIDLAVLSVADPAFFDTHPALSRSDVLPHLRDSVTVFGFPTGGPGLSITQGIVSRIDYTRYNYGTSGLRMQIDAALNPGNSGGPAVVGDKLVGIAFSVLTNAQNIGYVIPITEVEAFLADVADGHYDGKPTIYDEFQALENPALRSYLRLEPGVRGLVVLEPYAGMPNNPLRKWDVITRVGSVPVDDQGNVVFDPSTRVRFLYAVEQQAQKGRVPLTIVRNGTQMTVDMPLAFNRPKLIPYLQGTVPDYFICGPLVFSIASEDYLSLLTNPTNPNGPVLATTLAQVGSPLQSRRGDLPEFPGEELVIVASPFFSHPMTRGYTSPALRVVESVNGTRVKNLRHLVELIRDATGDSLVLQFGGHGAEDMVFNRQELLTATEQILTDNGIRSQGSAAMLEVWNKKP